MRFITDLHIHSKYSRGCSKELTLENIANWCQRKGIDLVSTGDFTHPAWFNEIKNLLIPAEAGFYKLKTGSSATRFVIGSEISCIYSYGERCRKIHLCLLAPSLESAEKLNHQLLKRGCNLKSDGRPIIGLSARELAKIAWEIDQDFFVFPAHVWTPWFSIFGSKSGFDSIAECFGELSKNIFALETGLSSDPAMNRQLSQLDSISLLSNSDAHSLVNLGREANVFDFESKPDYFSLLRAIKKQNQKNFIGTIEFFPEEGKYYLDGHADCGFSCLPAVSKKNNGLCPHCGKKLILGVMNRISELADRKAIESKYKKIIPLQEIIADCYAVGKNSKKVLKKYFELTEKATEFDLLLYLDEKEVLAIAGKEIGQAIIQVRKGKVDIIPGYDGIFGKISIK